MVPRIFRVKGWGSLRTGFLVGALSLGWAPSASAAPLSAIFTIDSSTSSLTLLITLAGSTLITQAAGSNIARFTGTMAVNADDDINPTSIEFINDVTSGATRADAITSGSYRPGDGGGSPGPAPGDAGFRLNINTTLGFSATIYAAVRDLIADISSGSIGLSGGPDNFTFTSSNETIILPGGPGTTRLDYSCTGDGIICDQLPAGSIRVGADVTDNVAGANQATTAASLNIIRGSGSLRTDTWTLTLPILVDLTYDISGLGVAQINAFGTILERAFIPVPEPSSLILLGLGAAGLAMVQIRKYRRKKQLSGTSEENTTSELV